MGDHKLAAAASAVHSGSLPDSRSNTLSRLCVATACRGRAHTTARRTHAFTLAELLVTTGVLALLVFLAAQLLITAAAVTTLGHKQMDADVQARQLLDRMAIDFAQMVKRSDVDYYVKSSWFVTGSPTPGPTGVRTLLQRGNDTIAFYSSVPGYYPSTGAASPMSLIGYRINQDTTTGNTAYLKLERMGKGLLWNGSTPTTGTPPPALFMPIPLASALPTPELPPPPATPTPSPTPAWQEIGSSCSWSDSEIIGPQVFRFEYYYLQRGQTDPVNTTTTYPAILSDTPWDTRICSCPSATPAATPTPTITPPSLCCHVAPEGMQDVAAVVVVIAAIDSKSRALVTDAQLAQLSGAPTPPATCSPTPAPLQPVLIDWGNTTCSGCPSQTQWATTPGLLAAQWRAALDANTIGLPQPAVAGIRVYERYLYLSPPNLQTP